LHTEDTTQEVTKQANDVDQQSLAAAQKMRARRPNFNFEEMVIPVGSELRSIRADVPAVVVIGPKKVILNNEEMFLTAATRQALALDYNVAPGPYWTFNGKLLSEIYEETYADVG
jgi:hypothetical protein